MVFIYQHFALKPSSPTINDMQTMSIVNIKVGEVHFLV